MLFKIGSETIIVDLIEHEMLGITKALYEVSPKILFKIIIKKNSYKEFNDLYKNLQKKCISSVDENGSTEKEYKLKKHSYIFRSNTEGNDTTYITDLYLEEK